MSTEPSTAIDLTKTEQHGRWRARMRRRILWTALALLMVACALPLLGYFAYDLQGRRQLQAEVDKTIGEPLTTSELNDYQGVPQGTPDNTEQWLTVLQSLDDQTYREMADFMPIMGFGIKFPPFPEPIPDEDRVAIEYFLATQRPKLDRAGS